MKAIIWGINGQDGYYLKKLLEGGRITVVGIGREDADITVYEAVQTLVQQEQPDYIFHLAANSTTRHEVMFENHETISTGTLNILEAVKNFCPAAKIFISGSGLQFENNNQPIKETDRFEARDPYSIARIQSVYAARYFRRLGLKIYVGYFFNHDSPRRSERHMAQKIAAAAARIKQGSDEKIEIGDLSVMKEWTFAGDIVKAMWLLVNQEEIYEACLGNGKGYAIKDWVKTCFDYIGKDYRDYVIEKPSFTAEYQQLVADPQLIMSLGFKPEVSFEQLAQMMIDAAS